MSFLQKLNAVKLVAMDVDGVLTDGKVLLLENGQQARSMHIKDGYAIQLAIKKGIILVVISGATDAAVRLRMEKLGVQEIYQGVTDKRAKLSEILQSKSLSTEQVVFLGDDIPDMEAMQMVGCAACPNDAAAEIKNISTYISPINGGEGFVREVLEKLLSVQRHWSAETAVRSL